jgi:hypothetical protein
MGETLVAGNTCRLCHDPLVNLPATADPTLQVPGVCRSCLYYLPLSLVEALLCGPRDGRSFEVTTGTGLAIHFEWARLPSSASRFVRVYAAAGFCAQMMHDDDDLVWHPDQDTGIDVKLSKIVTCAEYA